MKSDLQVSVIFKSGLIPGSTHEDHRSFAMRASEAIVTRGQEPG